MRSRVFTQPATEAAVPEKSAFGATRAPMGKSRKRAVDILGVQHQSGRCGSRASGRTSRKTIANGGRPTASRGRSIPQFPKALGLIQEVGELAEKEGYHPTSTSAGLCDCLEGPRRSKDCMRTTSSWRARLIGCSISRTISSTTRSEKLRHTLVDLSYGGNERSHRHRVRWNRLSRPPHRSTAALSRISRSDRVKASGSGAQTVWS